MNRLEKKYPLKGLVDTHLHTAPDTKPRLLSDVEAACAARKEKMAGIVIKSHAEPTSGRAIIASQEADFKVFGGVCLNQSVGGLNVEAVKTAARMGGKIVWFPTTSRDKITIKSQDHRSNTQIQEQLEDILNVILENDMVLATGHLKVEDIFYLLDLARGMGLSKVMVNHPLTRVVGATLEEQKEMSRRAYLEHCYVACLPTHDGLNPEVIAQSIKEVGARRCVTATDLGQTHNLKPVHGFKSYITLMLNFKISWKEIWQMCHTNPYQLFF